MAQRGCISNKCQRVITLHALAEICSILQIKENISIRHHYNIQEGTGKVIYKPSILILMKNRSISNRIDREAIKVPSSLGL